MSLLHKPAHHKLELFGFTRVPVVGPLAEAGYKVFARFRTDVTRGVGVDELIARRK